MTLSFLLGLFIIIVCVYIVKKYLLLSFFLQLGLQRYHGVGILGFNSAEWFIADIGAILAGSVASFPSIFPRSRSQFQLCVCNMCVHFCILIQHFSYFSRRGLLVRVTFIWKFVALSLAQSTSLKLAYLFCFCKSIWLGTRAICRNWCFIDWSMWRTLHEPNRRHSRRKPLFTIWHKTARGKHYKYSNHIL